MDLDRVRGAEYVYEGRLPDELIAVWACVGDPRPTTFCDEGLSPESSVSTILKWEDLRYQRPADEPVPLASTSERGIDLCLVVPSLVIEYRILSDYQPAVIDPETTPQPLERWLRERYELTTADILAARRAPRLEITLAETPPRRVSHPELGSGEVLADAGGVLLARFDAGKRWFSQRSFLI